MGWTYEHAKYYTAAGRVDIKAECDAMLNFRDADRVSTVLRSSVVGGTYYAAVMFTRDGETKVYAAVTLTHIDSKNYFNFGHKELDEFCGPCECKCPLAILSLLSDTDSEWALEWRARVRAYHAEKRAKPSLSALPVGTVIEAVIGGSPVRLIKQAPAYQFKRAWWRVDGKNTYMKRNLIQEYKVLSA